MYYVKYNKRDLPEYVNVVGVNMPLGFEIESKSVRGSIGNIFAGTEIGSKDIVINFNCKLDNTDYTVLEYMKTITDYFASSLGEPAWLEFEHIKGYHYDVVITSFSDIDTETSDKFGRFSITFRANNPYMISNDEVLHVVNSSDSIYNEGSVMVAPNVRIIATNTYRNLSVFIHNDDKKIKRNSFIINKQIDKGDVIDIDSKNRTVKLNGKSAINISSIHSSFLKLAVGENKITLLTNSKENKEQSIYLSYNNLRLN